MADEKDELTPEEKFAAEDPETMVPRALLLGRPPEAIVADLVRLDWSPQAARALVARVADDLRRFRESPDSRRRLLAEARGEWLSGCLMALLGVGAVAAGVLTALAGVGLPVLLFAFGLLVWGLMRFQRGWGRWRYYRRLPTPREGPGERSP